MKNINNTMDITREAVQQATSNIADFYTNRGIFITGATGFIGKALIYKLLNSCPDLSKIYILIRSKKNLNIHQRLDQLLGHKVFEPIKLENAKLLRKIIPIEGDITLDGLGISESDLKILQEDASIVIHSAATVKFDAPLRVAVEHNLLGTRRVLLVCHQLPNIEALVHVSTAYANCDRTIVEEVIYEQKISPQQLIDAVNWMSDEMIEDILPKLLDKKPNTYTLTKALAETLIMEECKSLPVTIIRPSIVSAAWKEPCKGWIDNINNISGILFAISKGILRTMLCERRKVFDAIPVDVVVNLILTAAWQTVSHPRNEIVVYNCASGNINPLTYGNVELNAVQAILTYPCSEMIRPPRFSTTPNIFHKYFVQFFDQILPNALLDGLLALKGQKPMMLKLCSKVNTAVKDLEFFSTKEWEFRANNMIKLSDNLKPVDKMLFPFDIREIDWDSYMEDFVLGIRKFLSKEDPSSLPAARRSMQRRIQFERAIEILIGIFGFGMIMYLVSLTSSLMITGN